MMRLLRPLAGLLLGAVAAAVVLLAVALSLVRLGVYYLPEYRAQVEERLAEAVGQPIRIEALETAWAWRDLRVVLEGVRLGAGGEGLHLPRLEVNLDLYASLRDGEPRLRELVLVEPSLTVERDSYGGWSVVGLGEPRLAGLEELDLLMAQPGRLRVTDASMDILDVMHGERYRFREIDAAVDESGEWRRMAGSGQLPDGWGGRAEFAVRWPRDADSPLTEGPLTVYAAAEDARPAIMDRLLGRPEASPYVLLAGSLRVWGDFPDGLPQPDGRERGGDFTVHARDGSGTFPYLFRAPIPFLELEAMGEWRFATGGWTVNVTRTRVDNQDGQVEGRVRVDKAPDQAPFLDIRASVDGRPGNAVNTSRYLPVGIMPPGLAEWLDGSIDGGTAARADVVFHGRADRFPFDDGTGTFDVRADVRDATLAYLPGWPALTELEGRLRFHGRSMLIEADHAEISGATVQEARARSDDLREHPLQVNGTVEGPGDAYLDFLRAMPPARDIVAAPLERLRLDGEHGLELALTIPFDGSPMAVDGTVSLRNGRARLLEPEVAMDGVSGEVRFDRRGIDSESITGRFLGSPVELELATDPGGDREARIRLAARAEALDAGRLEELLGGGTDLLSGKAAVQVTGDFPVFDAAKRGGDLAVNLSAKSALDGVSVAMPVPLGKDASESRSLEAALRIGGDGLEPVHLRYGEFLDARLDLGPGAGLRRAGLRFGGDAATLPGAGSIRLDGQVDRLELLDWRQWLAEHLPDTGGGDHAAPDAFDLTVSELVLGELRFADQRALGERDVTGWSVNLDGRDAGGTLFWPTVSGMAVEADLDHLRLQLPESVTDENADLDMPEDMLDDVEPASLPGLRLRIDLLELGGRPLGRLQVLGEADASGYTIGNILLRGEHHSLTGRAAWLRGSGDRTELELDVRSDDMGSLLASLGYRNVIRDGRGRGRVAVSARSAPLPLALEALDGEVSLYLREGSLTQVEPGAGRVFGLLSVANLPRRLMLNFSDVYEEGFAFDRIDAEFDITDGIAEPRVFTLVGPSARLEASGAVNLAERRYDQLITVVPRASSTLPILGGVLGGPPGAAAMFLAQQVFSEQLDRVARMQYRLTGPWADPVLEPVRRDAGAIADPMGAE